MALQLGQTASAQQHGKAGQPVRYAPEHIGTCMTHKQGTNEIPQLWRPGMPSIIQARSSSRLAVVMAGWRRLT